MKSWPLARRDAQRDVAQFSPATFTMQLTSSGPLRFPAVMQKDAGALPISVPGEQEKSFEQKAMRGFLRVAVVSQSMILVLLFAVAGLLFVMGSRAQSNLEQYYQMAVPVITELTNHTLGIMRNAHDSTSSVKRMTLHTENATEFSIPALIDSVNRTANAVSAVTRMAAHPVLKVSMEPQ